jgi:hypothetical protein
MNLYEQLHKIFPYLLSIRKLEGYVSVDIELPSTWKLPKKYVDEKMVVEQKSGKSDFRCLSFATNFNEDTLDKLFANLNNIIGYNLEREEKEKLFERKVLELKNFFDKSNLTELKDLEFQVKNEFKVTLDDEEQGENCVAVGNIAGSQNQGSGAVAVGFNAGSVGQGINAIAIGSEASNLNQPEGSISIGADSDVVCTGKGIAIGNAATISGSGDSPVVIGNGASANGACVNAIVLGNGSSCNDDGFYVPIREEETNTNEGLGIDADSAVLWYKESLSGTREVAYSTLQTQNVQVELTYDYYGQVDGVYFILTQYDGTISYPVDFDCKTFVIDHPKDKERHLVHACLEGPEAGVYYRGTAEITNNHSTTIFLPDYVPGWSKDFTVTVTAIYDGKVKMYATSQVDEDGKFNVYGENGQFNWMAVGQRSSINVEPLKSETNMKGFGPYKWVG